MKKKWIWIIAAVVFVGAIAAAAAGYNYLTKQYEQLQESTQPSEHAAEQEQEPVTEENTEVAAKTAPDFTVLNPQGREIKLSDYFGKPIVLNFWATWCGPCKAELPFFEKAYHEYGEEVEFVMVDLTDGVSETVRTVRQFMSANGYTFPVHYDTEGNAAASYGAYSIPMTFFIDDDGVPQGQYIGTIPEDKLFEQIDLLRGE